MTQWYPLIHYGLFFSLATFVGLVYVMKWRPTIANIIAALVFLISVPALYATVFHHTDARHEALAIGAGFLYGYLTICLGRFLRRRSEEGYVQVPPYVELTSAPPETRPWDALPAKAREGLRGPGDLGVYDDATLKPLRLKGRHCDIRV